MTTQEKDSFKPGYSKIPMKKRVEDERSALLLRMQDMNGLALQHVKLSASALSQSGTRTLSFLISILSVFNVINTRLIVTNEMLIL